MLIAHSETLEGFAVIAPPRHAKAVRFGQFELDLNTCWLTRRGQQVRLAVQPARLLALLAERRGELVTREELRSQLWPGDTFGDFDHGLNNAVNRLREALGDSAASPRYIQTAPRRGYRFIADVRVVAPAPGEETDASSPNRGYDSVTQANFAPAANQPIFGARASALSASGNHVTSEANGDRQTKSIAVSPLQNTSGDNSQDYFAEILTEALIGELARVHQLKVFPGSAMSQPWSEGEALSNSASEMHLDMLVEGSVRRLANHLRIVVKVLQLPTRVQIWSQDYDRELGEILAVQKEVASAIAAKIRTDLTPHEQMQFSSTLTVKPEAYDCYLSGRFYAQHQNKADNETAMLAFERAIAIDPGFALAYAELAQTYVWKLFLFAPHERQWQEKAFVSVEKALSIDSHLAVAYLARGRLLWTPANHFPHVRAIRDYRRAVALNPNLDEARNQLALIYCHIGYFEDALRESQEAALTNPNNNLAVYRTAQTFAFQGKHEQALAVLRTIPQDVNPSLIGYQTAWVLFNLGKSEEASALIDELLKDFPEDDGALFISMQALLAASAGEESVAEAKIEVAIRTGKGFGHFHHSAYHIAIAFALMNKPKQAVKWLSFASLDGFPCYPLFETDTNLSKLRQDAGFVEFMTKLKQQWVSYPTMF
jgi:TolB-like protein/DNA-binding winged helix-turn-helix (wHTH) protein/Tfp pilus assembly protein PilF